MSNRVKLVLAAFLLLLLGGLVSGSGSGVSHAAPSTDGIWKDVSEATIARTGSREIVPARYRVVAANDAALTAKLAQAPRESSNVRPQNSQAIISLPLPDGSYGRFSFVDSPIMESPLAAKYPQIKTYLGQGMDDRTATVRFDRTPRGFHAMILAASGVVFIDPYQKGDITNYISYYKSDYVPGPDDLMSESNVDMSAPYQPPSNGPVTPVGPQLRTYRLALAATGEYTAFYGGTVPGALAGMVTSVNRVTGVYEREVAVRMVLVANTDLLIYTDPNTDPYTNNNGSAMLGQNQTNIDAVIGNANYDIGHVFSTGGGGVASLGVPCRTGFKARGVTGSSAPVGDPFDIDYVAHEMGHQYGANHTFNGTTSNCGGGNRSGAHAFEPGSGSTIMAYAGICGAEDLQNPTAIHTSTLAALTRSWRIQQRARATPVPSQRTLATTRP
ncbi:MAG: reprolysin-like metallopeptidase [Chloroflexota bacterium]